MKRLRCCGRWCYWRLPIGPWACTICPRQFDGPMPASAVPRFWQYIDDLVARLPESTPEQQQWAAEVFGGPLTGRGYLRE